MRRMRREAVFLKSLAPMGRKNALYRPPFTTFPNPPSSPRKPFGIASACTTTCRFQTSHFIHIHSPKLNPKTTRPMIGPHRSTLRLSPSRPKAQTLSSLTVQPSTDDRGKPPSSSRTLPLTSTNIAPIPLKNVVKLNGALAFASLRFQFPTATAKPHPLNASSIIMNKRCGITTPFGLPQPGTFCHVLV